MTLQGCQILNVPAAEGPIGATPIEAMPPGPGYPALRTVPPRPQLSYPVEQRRSIAEALISDRENARYTRELVRWRSGQSELPPPPRPAPPPTEVAERIVAPPQPEPAETTLPPLPPLEDRAVADDGRRALSEAEAELDDGSLNDFIRDMVRDSGPPEAAQPALLPAPPPGSGPAPAAAAPPSQAEPASTGGGLFGWLRNLFSDGGADAAEAAPDQVTEQPDGAAEPQAAPPPGSAPAPAASADAPEPAGAPAVIDSPRPGPARAQLERLIEPPPPAPRTSARLAE